MKEYQIKYQLVNGKEFNQYKEGKSEQELLDNVLAVESVSFTNIYGLHHIRLDKVCCISIVENK